MVGQVQQHRIEHVEIDVVRVPAGVKVAGLILGGDKAAVQPDPVAAGPSEQLDRLPETVEETSAAFGPRVVIRQLDLAPLRGGSDAGSGDVGAFGELAGETLPTSVQPLTDLGECIVQAHVHECVDIP